MIKVSDYIMKRLYEYGIRHIFMIPGGGAMHLNDSLGNSKIKYICNHHEQASALAAEGYARTTNNLAVCMVTSGPGGTNAITGVACQWLDSVPVLYLSGQVKHETTTDSCHQLGLRQLGDQEINIVDIVKPITKFSIMITEPENIKYMLNHAIYTATHGRPGPVWVDIPLNIQSAMIDENNLPDFMGDETIPRVDTEQIIAIANMIKESKRPVIIPGNGVRIANGKESLMRLLGMVKIPILTTFNGFDLIPTEHELHVGRFGTVGSRAGNFALQNADLVICVGTRNNIRQVSYNWESVAPRARKVVVDIDGAELQKKTFKADIAIESDAAVFLEALYYQVKRQSWPEWLKWCMERKAKYPVVLPEWRTSKNVNAYHFIERLTDLAGENSLTVCGNGTACIVGYQASKIKFGQRMFLNSGCATMGYDLPAAIGAAIASDGPVICLTGDGSIQMNIQELQTIVHHNLPIKIFYLDNGGYISMKQTQNSFFDGRWVACDPDTGVSFPDILSVAQAYGIKIAAINNHSLMDEIIGGVLNTEGPVICRVDIEKDYIFSPKLSSETLPDGKVISKPLEDLYPFLSKRELKENTIEKV